MERDKSLSRDESISEADVSFSIFLATVTTADLSDWEFRLFNYHRLLGSRT